MMLSLLVYYLDEYSDCLMEQECMKMVCFFRCLYLFAAFV